MFCLVIGLLVLSCSKAETNRNAASTNSAAPAATPTATHSPATVAASGEKIGVPECDAFITAYENCVNAKVPEAQRATFQTGLKTWRTEWKKLADNPQTKAGLVAACKKQQELQRASLNKLYGCTL
jgi:hypothetical protein